MDNPESRPQPSGLTAEGDSESKLQRSGLTPEGDSVFATACASAAEKDGDWWIRAEKLTADLITSIQPIRSSEERRKAIANFVELLIKNCLDFPVQVETFGSVPLKTYLPDGDIDLTALSVHTDLEEAWAQDVVKALKRAEEEVDAEFRVKEVQYIQAEVKVIKCLVENIVVDISFNRTGGLNTFFFLEEVDRYISKKHLFKRSIILVKAWCYYESRILGAHHGLISTFALETLVLYILNFYHSSLRGPLEVLYTFLVYFSNFDWDQYCVSLWGPLSLKDLENEIISVTSPRKDGGRLPKRKTRKLSDMFLEQCMKEYSEQVEKPFAVKHLNILDPIRCKSGNNLGRSVNVGSFKRIRSAFGFGARTLGDVLCSEDQIDEKFKSFFSSTFQSLERYRSSGRPDIADIKQERIRATMASFSQPIAGNSNAFIPEGQWRQAAGKGRYYTNAEDVGRVQSKGSQPYTPVEHYEISLPVNRRSSEDHEHANHLPYRSPLPVDHQPRAPNQDSPRLGGNLGGQSGSSRSRNVSDPNLSLSNHDVGRPPGPSGDFKTNSSHGNFNRKVPSGEENDASTSGRMSAPSEQRKGQWPAQQRASPGDPTYQWNGVDSGSQSMLRPVPKYIPPHLQSQFHGYSAQMHLPVSSAMPVPASSIGGPPSAPSVNHSSSSGESFPRWTNSHLSMPEPVLSTSALSATKSLRISVAPSREGATSHNAGYSPHADEQREHWRSPIENQKQPLHGASFISNASAGRSFTAGYTSPSENCPSPSSAPPQVSPQGGGPSPPFEIGERLSRVSVSEAPSQLGGAGYSNEKTRSRENRPHSSDVKASVGMRAKVTNGSDKIQPSNDDCELEFGRSGDGHAAELRRHGPSQPSSEDTSVGGRQGAPYFLSPPHSYREMPTTVPFNRSAPLEPPVVIPGQSLLVPSHHAGATGTELNPPLILERQVLPVTVGVPLLTRVVENGSVSTGPSFRYRPVEGASQLHVVPQVLYYMPAPYSLSYYVMPTGTEGFNRGDPIGDLHSNVPSMDFGKIPGSQTQQESRSRTNPQAGVSGAERPEGTGAANFQRNQKDTLSEERSSEDDILFGDQKDAKKEWLKLFQDERKAFSDSMPAARYHGYPAISPHPSYSPHGMQQQPRGLPIHGNEDSLRKSGPGTNFFPPEHRESRHDFGRQGGNRNRSHGYQDRNNIFDESYQSHGSRYRSGGQGQGQQNKHDPRGPQLGQVKNSGSELDGENSTSPQSMEKRGLPSQTASMSNGFPGVAINAKPPVIMQQFVNDGSSNSSSSSSTGLLSPELAFGSLGPFHPN